MSECGTLGTGGTGGTGGTEGTEGTEESGARWQSMEGRTLVVLESVFAWLGTRALARCGGVCAAWRRAARAPAAWRRALLPRAAPAALRALAAAARSNRHIESWASWGWVREGMLWRAVWARRARLAPAAGAGAPLAHAALSPDAACLALLTEDAHLSMWEREERGGWRERRGAEGALSAEWRAAVSAQWAPRARRLLVCGALLLADRWEVLVLAVNDECATKVVCRTACSPGSPPCWADDDAFLTLRAQLLAPAHAVTTVWLNAAAQELYSEHAGVVMPLLRIYNEAATNISHILIVDAPSEDMEGTIEEEAGDVPSASYYHSLRRGCASVRMLIAANGVAEGVRGEARALQAWTLPDGLRVPPLRVRADLRERARLRRQRAASPPADLPEAAVRALCTPPAALCALPQAVQGIVKHPK